MSSFFIDHSKSEYEKFLLDKKFPIFNSVKWLNDTCENWKPVNIFFKEKISFSIPVHTTNRFFKRKILTPTFSPYIIPIFLKELSKNEKKEIINYFCSFLRSFDIVKIKLHHQNKDWLPYYWGKIGCSLRNTNILHISNEIKLSNLRRRDLAKALKFKDLIVETTEDTTDHLRIVNKRFKEKKVKPLDKNFGKAIFNSTINNYGKLFICKKDKLIISSGFIVYDKEFAYLLHFVFDSNFSTYKPNHLLLYEILKYCKKKGISFDFEGSMIEGIDKYYKSYGSKSTNYIQLNYKKKFLL
jgi:hypothetical protein